VVVGRPLGDSGGRAGDNTSLSFGVRPSGRRGKTPCFCKTVARCKGEEGAGEDAANQKSLLLIFYLLQQTTIFLWLITLSTFYLQYLAFLHTTFFQLIFLVCKVKTSKEKY